MDIELLQDIIGTVFSDDVPNYQARDNIEKSVSEVLPFKDVINIQNSNIKVELFHGNSTAWQLNQMENVLNKTFEVLTQHNFTPCTTDINIRAFLFDTQDQYNNFLAEYKIDRNNTAGMTTNNQNSDYPSLANVNIYLCQNFNDDSNSYKFTKDPNFVLAHEFFHGLYNMALCQHSNGFDKLYPAMMEGLASAFAWRALNELDYCDNELDVGEGSNIIKDNQLSFKDVFVGEGKPEVNNNAHRVGEAVMYFVFEKHPELIDSMSNLYLRAWDNGTQSLDSKIYSEFYDQVYKISWSAEFPYWIADQCEKSLVRSMDDYCLSQ